MTPQLTVITSRRPPVLSKAVRRGPECKILSQAGGLLVDGSSSIEAVSSLGELAALLQRLGPAQALTFGLPRGGDGRILSRAALAREGCAQGILTRTRDQFVWPKGPGILMLDHDPDRVPLSREELVGLIRAAAPGLADVAMLWWPSASSHICDAETGHDLTGLRGQRLYLMVRDAGDIPRAGAALVDRLWVAGHGRIVVSAAGAALERCPVDGSVWQPERLDFAAGAVCGEGLVPAPGRPPDDPRKRGAGRHQERSAGGLLGLEGCRCGTSRRQGRCRERHRWLRARNSWTSREMRCSRPKTAKTRRSARRRERSFRRAVENNVLTADFPVDVETASGQFEPITVGRILDDRDGFHGRLTRDPLEPGSSVCSQSAVSMVVWLLRFRRACP